MPNPQQWLAASRPRTLPAAIAPVLVGSGAAAGAGGFHLEKALLAAGVALALQIGVNLANDYSDGIRGTDRNRIGPQRLTASGAVAPRRVRNVAFGAFGVASIFGVALTILTGLWWLLAVGAAAVVAAWYYTGGKHPYGYAGFGEVFVFLFFGLVATLGTTVVQLGRVTALAVLGSIVIGLLACALLMVNNIRDIPTDSNAGKRTLAVRLGDRRARSCYLAMVFGSLLITLVALAMALSNAVRWAPLIPVAALLVIPAVIVTSPVRRGATGATLIPVLSGTAKLELLYAALLALTFALSA